MNKSLMAQSVLTLLLLSSCIDCNASAETNMNSTVSSRLSTTAYGADVVHIYTREDILQSGESNAADFIRNLPSNSFGSFRPEPGSTALTVTGASLRGTGIGRTLVLVDGRRLPKSPLAPNWQNLNLLPLGAIERIEIMTEGGSALYGADAIGGVINVVTRTGFQGAELMLGMADVSYPDKGGEREEGTVVFGAQSQQSSLLAGVSWNDREMILQQDLAVGLSSNSVYGNSFTTLADGFDAFNWTAISQACESLGSAFSLIPNSSSLNGYRCAYDPSTQAAEVPSLENKSLFAKANHQINDTWSILSQVSFTQVESFGQLAPTPDSSFFLNPLDADSPNNPTNPNSPLYDPALGLDPQPVNWWHRFASLGNREKSVTNQLLDFQLSTLAKWNQAQLEVGIRHSDNHADDVGRNFMLRSVVEAYIADGTYDLSNPNGHSEQVLNAMKTTLYREAKYDQDEWFATLKLNGFELPSGPAHLLLGAVYLDEQYFDQYDPQSIAGLVSGTAGSSAGGQRDTTAVFIEAGLPITDQVNIQLNVRYDDYSDVGSETSAKLAFMWHPFRNWSVRGSYSLDHSTPDLKIMNQPRVNSNEFTINPIPDSTRIANPLLRSEQAEQFSFNVNYQLNDHWDFSLGYWDLSLDDRIDYFSGSRLASRLRNGLPIPRGLSCEADGQNDYNHCIEGYGNGGQLDQSGIELDVFANHKVFGGLWRGQLNILHHQDYRVNNSSNALSGVTLPTARGRLTNSYEHSNWQVAYHINHIRAERQDDDFFYVPAWTSHDVQISYYTPWQSTFTVGVQNLTEDLPRFGNQVGFSGEYNRSLYHIYGRVVYARFSHTF